ncbi:MAG: hypothetical protein AAF682_26425 [Planctomycetota bacterium]
MRIGKASAKSLLENASWSVGLAGLLALLLGGARMRLESLRVRGEALEASVRERQGALRSYSAPDRQPPATDVEAALDGWSEMTADEGLRVAELAAAAGEAGVALLSLRSVASDDAAGDGLVIRSHELEGRGDQRQLADFLDRIYAARGLASIDRLVLHGAESGAPADQVRASLRVSWFAPGEEAPR